MHEFRSTFLDMRGVVFQFVLPAVLFATCPTLGPQTKPSTRLHRHWTETDSETLWRTRYTNCDYGFYVLLGDGVVAHATLPPSPNHGFLLPLPDIGRTNYLSATKETQFIWVDAHYDALDDQSLRSAVSSQEEVQAAGGSKVRKTRRERTRLAGLQAIWSKAEFPTEGGKVVEEAVTAVRSGIVYTIGLRTNLIDQSVDEEQFRKVLLGFRLLKLPRGECRNG